jgi:hypothetical protein
VGEEVGEEVEEARNRRGTIRVWAASDWMRRTIGRRARVKVILATGQEMA